MTVPLTHDLNSSIKAKIDTGKMLGEARYRFLKYFS